MSHVQGQIPEITIRLSKFDPSQIWVVTPVEILLGRLFFTPEEGSKGLGPKKMMVSKFGISSVWGVHFQVEALCFLGKNILPKSNVTSTFVMFSLYFLFFLVEVLFIGDDIRDVWRP